MHDERIQKIINKYNNYDISENQINSFIELALLQSNKTFNELFYNNFEKLILKKISSELKLKKFIDEDITLNDIAQLKKIVDYLDKEKIAINSEFIISLLLNQKVNNLVSSIIDENIDNIKKNKFEKISKDKTIILILKNYCIINNIEFNEDDSYTDDYIKMYMKEISEIPLLTKEEELDLAFKSSNGDKKARDRIIESNLKLVVSIARRYVGQGLSFLDLVQEGNIGLMTAVDRFDMTKGYKFSTYAYYWIQQSILLALSNKSRLIRVPAYFAFLSNKVLKYKRKCEINRYVPTEEELAIKFNISLDTVKLLAIVNEPIISYDSKIETEDDEYSLNNYLASDENIELDYENRVLKDEMINSIKNCSLSDKEKKIIFERFGLLDNKPKTLDCIAKEFNITRERVRQIINKSLSRLKYMRNFKDFKIYYKDSKKK